MSDLLWNEVRSLDVPGENEIVRYEPSVAGYLVGSVYGTGYAKINEFAYITGEVFGLEVRAQGGNNTYYGKNKRANNVGTFTLPVPANEELFIGYHPRQRLASARFTWIPEEDAMIRLERPLLAMPRPEGGAEGAEPAESPWSRARKLSVDPNDRGTRYRPDVAGYVVGRVWGTGMEDTKDLSLISISIRNWHDSRGAVWPYAQGGNFRRFRGELHTYFAEFHDSITLPVGADEAFTIHVDLVEYEEGLGKYDFYWLPSRLVRGNLVFEKLRAPKTLELAEG